MAIEPAQANNQIARKLCFELEKFAIVNDGLDHRKNVVRLAQVLGDDFLERIDWAVWLSVVGLRAGAIQSSTARSRATFGSLARHSSSLLATKSVTPETSEWILAPPNSSIVTVSPSTSLMTAGPVMNIWLLF